MPRALRLLLRAPLIHSIPMIRIHDSRRQQSHARDNNMVSARRPVLVHWHCAQAPFIRISIAFDEAR
jgi:hypothetical protein